MNSILSITSKATEQIKKIMSNAPNGMDSVVVGIDKSGCSGYSYKLDFGNSSDFKKNSIIGSLNFFPCLILNLSLILPAE